MFSFFEQYSRSRRKPNIHDSAFLWKSFIKDVWQGAKCNSNMIELELNSLICKYRWFEKRSKSVTYKNFQCKLVQTIKQELIIFSLLICFLFFCMSSRFSENLQTISWFGKRLRLFIRKTDVIPGIHIVITLD